jgi:tripartite-type tricarboxylate transporter receptor subunit TctC
MVLLLSRAGLTMTNVTYKGGGPATADVIAGHLPAYFANLSEALPQVRAGTLRPLAITSERRSAQLPDVPTVGESGYAGFRTVTWNGLMAPAGTPRDIITTLAGAVARGIATPAVRERLVALGIDPLGDGPEKFAATIAADIPFWAQAVHLAGAAIQ